MNRPDSSVYPWSPAAVAIAVRSMETVTSVQCGWFSMAASIARASESALAGETGVPANW